MRLIIIVFSCFIFQNFYAQTAKESLDSIYVLRSLTTQTDLPMKDRFVYARKAILLSKKTKRDTTILESNRNLSFLFLVSGEYDSLYRINSENYKLSRALKDTLKMGYSANNLGFYFQQKLISDSAYFYYYRAQKYYSTTEKKFNEVGVLRNMAMIQEIERDFIGSEINSIEGIRILSELKQNPSTIETLWGLHTNVGIVSGGIENFEKSLEYHKKALKLANKLEDNYDEVLFSKVNIAITYRRAKNYSTAKTSFQELLKYDSIRLKDPVTYSTILSNFAYTKLLNREKDYGVQQKMLGKAMFYAQKEEDLKEQMSSSEYLAELFLKTSRLDSAEYYANRLYNIAKDLNNYQYTLKGLLLKSKTETGDNSKKYLFDHIKLNDSLILAERSIRNKFARINLETDKIQKEKEVVSRQNILLLVASSILAITLLLFYVIKTRREKIKELQLAQQQQKANEEIYNLMLSQQDKMDEARAVEKKRISQDIHDGILGRLFGVRLNLDSLNFVKTDAAITRRSNYINELKEIEFDIRKVSHDLNTDFVSNSSFSEIIKTLVETQCDAYGLAYSIAITKSINWELVSNKTKVHIYRITQESLQNIYKHAEASLVSITINEDNNLLSLAISDDGIGFENDKIKEGIGLKNMKSRVEEINATFNIKTIKNEGTTIEIDIPV